MGLRGDLHIDINNNFSIWFNSTEKKHGIVSVTFGNITLHIPLVKLEELIEQGEKFLEHWETKEVKKKLQDK